MFEVFAVRRAQAGQAIRRSLGGGQMLAFLPALALAGFWIGGEWLLLAVALGLPAALAAGGALDARRPAGLTGAESRDLLGIACAEAACETAIRDARLSGLSTAAIAFDLDGLQTVAEDAGDRSAAQVSETCLTRLRHAIRVGDQAWRIGDARFLVLLEPRTRLDAESVLEAATRLQPLLEEPVPVDGAPHCLSAAAGFCTMTRLREGATGERLLEATLDALAEAKAAGPSAIRAWSDGLDASRALRRVLRSDAAAALEAGQIQPWFQPQICTSTGEISGAEALARWVHPERGLVSPQHFLDALEDGGHMGQLSDVMIRGALAALASWDTIGLGIQRVAINLSGADLRDPTFVERLKWELDRHDLRGDRLCAEVLETAFRDGTDDGVATTIAGLKRLGCRIDLDDFGTGSASIMALHRLPIDRVKIDRGFIAGIDRNERQRRMVAGILSLAEHLGMETLAEGVESAGEHALLAQLGCDHVQGFRIARPMPAGQMPDWVVAHRQSLATPDLSRRAK